MGGTIRRHHVFRVSVIETHEKNTVQKMIYSKTLKNPENLERA